MGEGTNVEATVGAGAGRHPTGYQAMREVRARAAVASDSITAEERTAVTRLNRLLVANGGLNPNVPRGYYLNIRI